MKRSSRNRGRTARALATALSLALLIGFSAGCCTCKISRSANTIIIVKRPQAASASQFAPAGAAIGFDEKLNDGDTILFINRYDSDVKVTFPNGYIEGTNPFLVKKCKEMVVTIKITVTTPLDEFHVIFDAGTDHGGAKIIVDPGGP